MSEDLRADLLDVQERWSVDDCQEAHDVLDALEEARAQATATRRSKASRG